MTTREHFIQLRPPGLGCRFIESERATRGGQVRGALEGFNRGLRVNAIVRLSVGLCLFLPTCLMWTWSWLLTWAPATPTCLFGAGEAAGWASRFSRPEALTFRLRLISSARGEFPARGRPVPEGGCDCLLGEARASNSQGCIAVLDPAARSLGGEGRDGQGAAAGIVQLCGSTGTGVWISGENLHL